MNQIKPNNQTTYLDKEFEKIFTPVGESKVALSPNFSIIMMKYISGETPETISKWLNESENEIIAPSTIRDYMRRHVPRKLRVNVNVLRFFHQHMVNDIDELSEVVDLVSQQKRRLFQMFVRERSSGRGLVFDPGIRYEIGTLSQLLQLLINLKKDLGVLGDAEGKSKSLGEEVVEITESHTKTLKISRSTAIKAAGVFNARRNKK